jgi:hypothetical protein
MTPTELAALKQEVENNAKTVRLNLGRMPDTIQGLMLYYMQIGYINGHTEATLSAIDSMYRNGLETQESLEALRKTLEEHGFIPSDDINT